MRYTAKPSFADRSAWGVTDAHGAISYEPDMTKLQAQIVAMFHNNGWASELEEISNTLEVAGIDFEAL